jgi:hypothetical protein
MLFVFSFLFFAQAIIVVDIQNIHDSEILMPVQTASGLENRDKSNVFVISSLHDKFWLDTLIPDNIPKNIVHPLDFLKTSYQKWGGILYNHDYLQSIITLAGVFSAIPIDDTLFKQFPNTTIVYNATFWENNIQATDIAMKYVNSTSSLAIQGSKDIQIGYLVDWIVNQKLFTIYLKDMCVPFTTDNKLLKEIVSKSNWPIPIRAYGYNFQNPIFGAFPWEAETTCISSMGQIASSASSNLAFWSQWNKFKQEEKLKQTNENEIEYNSNTTYIALVYGDLDNIDYVQNMGQQHMRFRVNKCIKDPTSCFPLTWTLSPNLIHISPEIMRWYYKQASQTGQDWFIMPPSGTLYSYPGLMDNNTQTQYVNDQNKQALIMNTHGSIHWELLLTWKYAFNNYFPRYINTNGTTSFFLNNVPWMIPILEMEIEDETYKWFDNSVVVFKPAHNWCPGMKMSGYPGNSTQMANKINKLKVGSIQYIYIIQNTDPNDIFEMVKQLESHVKLVGYENLVKLSMTKKNI